MLAYTHVTFITTEMLHKFSVDFQNHAEAVLDLLSCGHIYLFELF